MQTLETKNPDLVDTRVEPRQAGEQPRFRANWDELLMVHFAVTPEAIQTEVPWPLDTLGGEAFVTLVAFRQTQLRFIRGRALGRLAAMPVDDHAFLNIRTYVRGSEGPGIFFMKEFINHPLARVVGPPLYGLPYHLARMRHGHKPATRHVTTTVRGWGNTANIEADYALVPEEDAEQGTEEYFLHERYIAYTRRGQAALRFRVWHAPWQMHRARVRVQLKGPAFDWAKEARLLGAAFTPGIIGVGLGAPVNLAS